MTDLRGPLYVSFGNTPTDAEIEMVYERGPSVDLCWNEIAPTPAPYCEESSLGRPMVCKETE